MNKLVDLEQQLSWQNRLPVLVGISIIFYLVIEYLLGMGNDLPNAQIIITAVVLLPLPMALWNGQVVIEGQLSGYGCYQGLLIALRDIYRFFGVLYFTLPGLFVYYLVGNMFTSNGDPGLEHLIKTILICITVVPVMIIPLLIERNFFRLFLFYK